MNDQITILRTAGKRRKLAKTFNGEQWHSYDSAKFFNFDSLSVSSLSDIMSAVDHLASDPHACAVRGARRKDIAEEHCDQHGRLKRNLQTLADAPRHWVMFDVDGFEPDADPTSETAILEWVAAALPDCFQEVDFVYQFSSSAGFSDKLKAHVWFLLDTAYDGETLIAWADDEDLDVDRAGFRPTQVLYTANPVFTDGAVDPIRQRVGRHESLFGDELVALRIDPEVIERARERTRKGLSSMPDPSAKDGWVGAFCRAYPIEEIIDEWLPDIFEWHDRDAGTLNFLLGSGAGRGAFITQDGQHVVNMHASDPLHNRASNAFDLVRCYLHDGVSDDPEKPVTQQESYKSMLDVCARDRHVRAEAGQVNDQEAEALFAGAEADIEAFAESHSIDRGDDETGEEGTEGAEDNIFAQFMAVCPDDWKAALERHPKTAVLEKTGFNLKLLMICDPLLRHCIGTNEMCGEIRAFAPLPWRHVTDTANGSLWEDRDDHRLIDFIRRRYGVEFPPATVQHAVNVVADLNRRHPVRRYIRSLEWDGTPRLDTWLHDFLGAEQDEYTRQVGAKWLTAAVARVMRPGCKFDNALVLEGVQGTGKSTALNILAGDQWFTDTFGSFRGKESVEQISGVWIVEMGELSAMRRTEVEEVKEYLSRREDRARLAYAKRAATFPRQCVFAGTTNRTNYLQDETGNRRFWPVATGQIDTAGLRAARDQLWAEAYQRYLAGEFLDLEGSAKAIAKESQEERVDLDPIQDEVTAFLEMEPDDTFSSVEGEDHGWLDGKRQVVTINEIWAAVGSTGRPPTKVEQNMVRRCIARSPGWSDTAARIQIGGERRRRHYRVGGVYDPDVSDPLLD